MNVLDCLMNAAHLNQFGICPVGAVLTRVWVTPVISRSIKREHGLWKTLWKKGGPFSGRLDGVAKCT